MKRKYLIFLLAIFLVLSINVASAADNATEVIALDEENTLGDSATAGTFDELQKYIDSSTTGQISLNKSYTYDSTDSVYETGIKINKTSFKSNITPSNIQNKYILLRIL